MAEHHTDRETRFRVLGVSCLHPRERALPEWLSNLCCHRHTVTHSVRRVGQNVRLPRQLQTSRYHTPYAVHHSDRICLTRSNFPNRCSPNLAKQVLPSLGCQNVSEGAEHRIGIMTRTACFGCFISSACWKTVELDNFQDIPNLEPETV